MKRFLSLVFVSFLAVVARAADVAFTLMPPAVPVVSGSDVRVDLAAMNPGALEQPFTAPISLAARLAVAGGEREVTLDAVSAGSVVVSPGSFAVRRYHFILPADVIGRAVLEVNTPALGLLHAVIDIQAPPVPVVNAPVAPAPEAPLPPQTPLDELHNTASVASGLSRTFTGRFMPNQPIYFLYGGNADQAVKFQFSFDYRLATYRWGKPGEERVSSLRIGYTQRSLWDIYSSSSPFYDTSYMPELAFHTDSSLPPKNSWFTWMGSRLSFQHESNGKDGTDSRSLNTVYIRPRFVLGDLDHWFAVMVPEIWTYIGGVDDNPRLKDYRGYGKLHFVLGRNTGPTLRVAAWTGKDWDHGSYLLDLAWPLKTATFSLQTYLYVQYFNGYGESLRSYNEKGEALRFGIGLVR